MQQLCDEENKKTIVQVLIDDFLNEIMTEDEKELVRLSFSSDCTQEQLDNILKNWSFEKKPLAKSLLFAYFQKNHPDLKFNSEICAILKPLFQKYRFNNIAIVSPFMKIGKKLNENNIFPMVLKGLAMRYFRPDLPRIMNDVDILVLNQDFMKTIELILPFGYYYEKIDVHSVDLHDNKTKYNAIDVHRFIYLGSKNDKNFLDDLFKRATLQNVFGIKAFVPCYEDMLFIVLANLSRNLKDDASKAGIVYAIYDCKFLLDSKKDFNWDIIKENAQKTNTQAQIGFVLKLINQISKDVVSDDITNNLFSFEKTQDYSTSVLFNRFYLKNLRQKCRSMKVKDIFNNFGEYLRFKPRYFILKFFIKHPKLIRIFIKDLF